MSETTEAPVALGAGSDRPDGPEGSDRPDGREGSDRPDGRDGRRALAEFELEGPIGRGGMATIHRARERATGRHLAIKVVHAHLSGDAQLTARFEHEVRSQLGLSHPNLVEMVGWGEDEGGRLFMALELVLGGTLKDLLQRRRKLPLDVALLVARDVARGLSAAHGRGLVHRDVKPANVMLCADGRVKVADFGIARTEEMTRLTSTGSVIGTPAYMSPEQALARPIDARSDLFSLGVVLHEMLVGGNPFQTGNPATTVSRVVSERVRPLFESLPETPAAVEALVESLLAKTPERRPATAAEVAERLDRILADEQLAGTAEVLAAFLADPEVVGRRLLGRAAQRHFERGLAAYDGGKGAVEAAIWDLFLAAQLDPSHARARTWLEQVSRERGWCLQRKATPQIEELEARLKEKPDDVPTLVKLAKLHKAQGNFLQVIFYYRRAKALRPPDAYTQNQLETLLSARSAVGLEATGVFETREGVPVRVRPQVGASTSPAGWGEMLGGLWQSGWGKVALGGVSVLAAALVLGLGVDNAVQASRGSAGPRSSGPPADVELEPAFDVLELLERARAAGRKGRHERAEALLRELLEEHAATPLAAEAAFALGDALERQGRRDEALEVHARNALDRGLASGWAQTSQARRGELLALAGDEAGAQSAWEELARQGSGEPRLDALQGLGDLARSQGRLRAAVLEYQAALADSRDAGRTARLHLALAETYLDLGDAVLAESHFAQARDGSDHRSEEFRLASEGLERAGRLGEATVWAPADRAPATPGPDSPSDDDAAGAWSASWDDEQDEQDEDLPALAGSGD